MPVDAHPGARLERPMADARLRAIGAIVALGLTVASRTFTMAVQAWQLVLVRELRAEIYVDIDTLRLSDTLARIGQFSHVLLFIVTAVLFVQWLWIVIRLTVELGGRLRWSPRDALLAFVIPFVNIWEPYRLLRDVTGALAPDGIPEPRPRLESDGSAGYRDGRLIIPPPRLGLPVAFIGAWWTTYWLAKLASFAQAMFVNVASASGNSAYYFEPRAIAGILSDAAEIVSALFAILVVRAVAARLAERFRRIRHNPVDVLREAGITLFPEAPARRAPAPDRT